MSKTNQCTLETRRGRKRGHGDQEEENPIFCEKCMFVFQGDAEFKNHGCQQNTDTVPEKTNKKPTISLERRGKDAKAKVRDVNITMVKSSLHFRIIMMTKLRHLMLI